MTGSLRIWMFRVLFLGLMDPSEGSLRPRVSFSQGSPERLLGIYRSPVKNTSTLLLSADAGTLFVGARDALLSLDVSGPDSITLKDKLEWTPSAENVKTCTMASKTDCGNFIRILRFFNSTHLYVCGTNAYKPQAIIISASSLRASRDAKDAKNCCPYSSTQRNAATIVDEELYTATNLGFFENKKVISRCHSRESRNNLELETVPKLLQDPAFISSTYVASEGKILLFFTENGDLSGDLFTNSFTVSRVAQVCTDDNGGSLTLQKRWTSFAKAQLVCQQGEELQFNKLQDIVQLSSSDNESPDSTLFYGVFTSQWSVSSGLSAVCAFSLTDIKSAFSGDYMTFDLKGNHWSHQPNTDGKLGKCGLFNDTDRVLNIVKKSFLTREAVHSVGKNLLLSSAEERYSRLAVQRTQAANGQSYTILYLLTESGFLHKAVLLANGPHIIEEIQIFTQPQTVKNMLLSNSKGVLFIGSSEGVFSVPVSNCSAYLNCAECVLARDPFCGWDAKTRVCTTVSGMASDLQQDVESGNVREHCILYKNNAPKVKQIAQFNEIVVLPCQSRSRLAKVTWRFSNNSVVSQFPYLQRADGSLVFPFTPETVNTYRCMSEELGFEQTITAFDVNLPFVPRSHLPPSYQQPDFTSDSEPIPDYDTTVELDEHEPTKGEKTPSLSGDKRARTNHNFFTNTNTAGKDAVCISQKSYYSEMVAFCILFVICFFTFAVFVGLWRHSLRCNKTAPQKQPQKDNESDNIWQAELEEKGKAEL